MRSQSGNSSESRFDPGERTLSVERRHLIGVVRQLDTLQRWEDTDIGTALREITKSCVVSVPGALYAGITLVDELGAITTLAATHPHPETLDGAQRDADEGPCLSAAWTHRTIRIDDLATETRWPRYRDFAMKRTSVRTVMSFRLHGENRRMAALNFYADTAGVFDDESVELGLVYAAHTGLAWNSISRGRQFQSALASRDVIGQAKGMIMERSGLDAIAAFDLLRRLSQSSNTKLSDVAEKLVAAEHPSRQ